MPGVWCFKMLLFLTDTQSVLLTWSPLSSILYFNAAIFTSDGRQKVPVVLEYGDIVTVKVYVNYLKKVFKNIIFIQKVLMAKADGQTPFEKPWNSTPMVQQHPQNGSTEYDHLLTWQTAFFVPCQQSLYC